MSRKLLGVIAAVLLVVGGITAVAGPGGNSATGFAGGCIRVGLVLGALWLALPQIQATLARMPGWVVGWFVGKGKKPPGKPAEGEQPVVRERRPRRRSRG
jgi:hypothetical protein